MAKSDQSDDLDQLKKATAVLVTCICQTLHESVPGFEEQFLDRLSRAYRDVEDNSVGDVRHQLETLAWTRSLITGFDFAGGQGKPFLK